MSDLYLVTGRLFGADDDDAMIVQAPNAALAEDAFRSEMLSLINALKEHPDFASDEDESVIVVSVAKLSDLLRSPRLYTPGDSAFHLGHGLFRSNDKEKISAREAGLKLDHRHADKATDVIECNDKTLALVGALHVQSEASFYEGSSILDLARKRNLSEEELIRWLDGADISALEDCTVTSEPWFEWRCSEASEPLDFLTRCPSEMLATVDWSD